MFLTRLTAVQFRNYAQLDVEFSPRINCFTGNNGVGKTNLLDAVFYLSLCQSHLANSDTLNIQHGTDFFMIQGYYQIADSYETIHCSVKKGQKKTIKRNDKTYKRLSEHIGLLPVVMVSPVDSELIQGNADQRRRMMDEVISQYNRPYMEALIRYNRALQQRNQLLKDFGMAAARFDASLLDVWDMQIAEAGRIIYTARKQFAEQFVPVFQQFYNTLGNSSERVSVTYQSQLHNTDSLTLLSSTRDKDLQLQYTSAGVHRDDLALFLNHHPARYVGSQGQQKTFVLALQLAKFSFIREITGITPFLLLDDIFDKLDESRVENVIKLVADNDFGQIFITDTHKVRLQRLLSNVPVDSRFFEITPENVTII